MKRLPASTLGLENKLDRLIQQGVSWAANVDVSLRYQLYVDEGGQYLIEGLLPEGIEADESQLSQGLLIAGENAFEAHFLSEEEYHAFRTKDIEGVFSVIIIFALVLFGGFILNYIQALLLNYAAQRQIYHMRQALFDHLMHQSLAFFDKNPVGRLVTRVTNDMKNISEMYTNVLINAFKDFLLLAGTIFVMFALNPMLATVSLITFPLIGLAAWRFRMKAREAHRAVKVKIARINASLAENISGMKIIQIFDQQSAIKEDFKKINEDHLMASLDEIRVLPVSGSI